MNALKNYYLLFIAGAAFSLSSCSDENMSLNIETNVKVVLPDEVPTEDMMAVTSSLKAYIFQAKLNGVSAAVVNRMKNVSAELDATVKTVIVPGRRVYEMNGEEYRKIITVFLADGNLVLLEPTIGEYVIFWRGMETAYNKMLDEYALPETVSQPAVNALKQFIKEIRVVDEYTGKEEVMQYTLCNAVGMRGEDIHYLMDEEDETLEYTANEPAENGDTITTKSTISLAREATDYTNGQRADALAQWINDQPNMAQNRAQLRAHGSALMATRAGVEELQELVDARVVTYTYTAFNGMEMTNKRYGESDETTTVKLPPIHTNVTIRSWAVHGMEDNCDYYLVHETINPLNSQSGMNKIKDENEWTCMYRTAWTDDYYYGFYLKKIQSTDWLVHNGDNILSFKHYLEKVSPQTQVGGHDVYTGIDWSLGGSLGISKDGPEAGLDFGVSFSSSISRSMPDLAIIQNADKNENPVWSYNAESVEGHNALNGTTGGKHDMAPDCLINDCWLDKMWVWRVPNPEGSYHLNCIISQVSEMLHGYCPFFTGLFGMDSYYQQVDRGFGATYQLPVPARHTQDWQMDCYVKGDPDMTNKIVAFLESKRYYKEWKPSFESYVVEQDDYSATELYFVQFMQKLENDKEYWKRHGYVGDFVFELKRADTNEVEKTYTFKVEAEQTK